MLADLGRRADAALTRVADAAHEAVHATALHARRVVGAVSVALTRVAREAADLVWDYQDVASDLRRSDDAKAQPHKAELAGEQTRPALRVVGSAE